MIYNAPSIYKNGGGGGGGGYKDGGELVDAKFIEVENNTVSSYENVSRSTVNFYFEYNDGDVLNSVINFSTQVNSTVNVYYKSGDIYYLLGVIGSNSVIANKIYIINIIGKSYEIEETQETEVGYIDYDGTKYKMIEVDGIYWPNTEMELPSAFNTWNDVVSKQSGKWRLPTQAECSNLVTHFGDIQAIKGSTPGSWSGNPGTNSSGLNFDATGYWQSGLGYRDGGVAYYGFCKQENSKNVMVIYYGATAITFSSYTLDTYRVPVRYVYDPNL